MIVLSVLRFTASDYIFLFWLWLYCLSYDLRHLITSFYFGYDCIVSLTIYGIWLHLFYFGYDCIVSLMIYGIWLHLFYFGYDCIVCLKIYGIWLHLFILAMIVLSVLRFTASDYIFLFWLWLYCLSYDLRHLITSFYFGYDCIVCLTIYGIWLHLFILAIVLSVLRFTAFDYIFLFWLWLYCLSYDLRHLITSFYFGYCIVCLKIYGIWLHLFILAMIVLSVLRFTAFDYIFLFWLLYCLSYDLRHLITSFYFGYDCIVCLKIYGIWLHLFILAMIVLSLLRFTAFDYIFLFWLWLYCLS